MEKILKKTESEKRLETTDKRIKVSDTEYFYWACDLCNIAFFGDDEIISSSDGYKRCPLITKRGWIFPRKCLNHIYGGDEECFNKYYKLANPITRT